MFNGAGKCLLVGALALVIFAPVASAKKSKPEQVLYDFCAQANCSDGSLPQAGLIMDGSGNLYGTTSYGGNPGCTDGCGTVFRLAPDGTQTVLYSFCSEAHCSDGDTPVAGMIMDGAGNLYGTTLFGGNETCSNGFASCGTIFKLAPDGTETVLYSFCAEANCADGANPVAGLVMDNEGNLYGTTQIGGTSPACGSGCGTAFEITPAGAETTLYNFCSQANCSDGSVPEAGLIIDGSGNLYGTIVNGGHNLYCCGTVFELAPNGTESVLYRFCSQDNCNDGAGPNAGVIMDGAGNLYGTTFEGGIINGGRVFMLAPGGAETVLHVFTGNTDGFGPYAGLLRDSTGNLYGTTYAGGSSGCKSHAGCGTVFKLAPDGTETQLYVFKKPAGGVYPESGVVADGKGNGTAPFGGLSQYGPGLVYKINVGAAATGNAKH